jgi:eukaryotic-like serine/threonine-protein kinase
MAFTGTARFRPIRLLGSGGMGNVYLVYDKELDTKVALKTISLSSGLELYRFKREFRFFANLRHTNLVTLHELTAEDAQCFFTMEYVQGVSFDRYVQASDPGGTSVERLRSAVRQLCAGVQAIHDVGCVHRDLKPSNVLVTDHGRVVILDFGLARRTDSQSLSGGGLSGTPTYMAPEQALEAQAGPPSDWYAVGTMLYEALTGRCPFAGGVLEMLMQKQSVDPPPPTVLNPNADPEMSALCMRLMDREPRRRPTGPELLEQLGAEVTPPLVQTGTHTAIGPASRRVLGREPEMAVLKRAYTDMSHGKLGVVIVEGTSGIGKTSLVESFLAHETPCNPASLVPLVLRGRCHERETLPFKAFDSVVDTLTDRLLKLREDDQAYVLPDGIQHLSEIFPVLHRVRLIADGRYQVAPLMDGKELRNQAFIAFRDLLVRMARIRPVVIFIDDLQWADLDSFSLLRAVMQQPGAPGLLLILNRRPISDGTLGGTKSMLREIDEQSGVTRTVLGPLPDDQIEALAHQLLESSALPDVIRKQIAETIVGEAGGNPFFVVELVQHFESLVSAGGQLSTHFEAGERHLDQMILKRVAGLPDESRRLLEIVAMAADPLPQQTLAAALGVPFGSEAWEHGITALVDARMASRGGRRSEDTVIAYHDRIREAVAHSLDEPRVRQLHRRLAEAVEAWDQSRTDRLARYWLVADDHERAKRYANAAADEARNKLAFDRAAEFYETAVALETDASIKIDLLRALGECRASNGDTSLAAEAYQRAAGLGDRTQSTLFHHLAAEQLLRGGQIARGLEVLANVLKEAGLRMAPDGRGAFVRVAARLIWLRIRGTKFVERPVSSISAKDQHLLDVLWSVNTGLGVVDILHADDFLLRFLLLALRTGDSLRVSKGLCMLAGQIAAIGKANFPFSKRLLSQAQAIASRSTDPAAHGLTRMCKGVVHYFNGEWAAAREELFSVEQHFMSNCHGMSWELATTRIFGCYSLRMGGRLKELCERFDRYTADADRTGDRYLATNLRSFHTIVWLIRDDLKRAAKDIEGLLDAWPGDRYQFQHFTHLFARCEQALYAGQPEVAYRAIIEENPKIRRSAMLKISAIRLEHSWVSARVALAVASRLPEDRRGPYLDHARRNIHFLRNSDHDTGVAMGMTADASVAWLSPDADRPRALEDLGKVIGLAEKAGAMFLAESARRWLGEHTGGERGEEWRNQSEAWMADQGVKNPVRLAEMMVPGFLVP